MFFDDESIHLVWHKLNDIERRLSQGGEWLPSSRQYDSMGRTAWESSSFNGTSWNARMTRVERVRRALELSGSSARQLMARQLSGLDLSAIWPILLDACQDIALYYGGSVIAGAALGGVGGAFFGGVGAVPGAALGAAAGAQVGGWVMGLLGLKSLAEELGSAFPEALKHYERGFREAWGPTHRDRQHDVLGLHTSSGDPQAGAWHLAQGHVVLVMALLTALAAWLTRGKGDKAVLLQEIRQSRRLGPRVADWVAQNEGKLVSHPQLRPRKNAAVPERPIMQERAPKSGGPEPDKAKAAGSGGGVGANAAGQTGARSLSLKEMMRQEAAAVRMYDDIRASTTDVQNIVANTGLKDFQVTRVKNHLFYDDTHQLRERVGRFDPDYEIGQAWQRMEAGQHLPQDIQLFKHEYFESRFEKIFRTNYGTAHNKTQLRYPSPLD